MKFGSVHQRHARFCPRDSDGHLLPHRCRGTWGYYIDLPRQADRARRQVTKAGFPTKAAAQAAMHEVAELLLVGSVPHTMTVGEYLNTWLASKHALKASTKAHYGDAIRLYLVPNIGHVQLLELRVEHLDRMYAAMITGASGRTLSNGSIRRVHACLRSALNSAAKRRLIVHNPAQYVELPPERPKRPTPWTVEQARSFLSAISGDRLAPLYHVLIVTGMRRGEAVGLRWQVVDLERQELLVTQQITDVRGRATVSLPKTRKSIRGVPLDPWTAGVLKEHRQRQLAERQEWGLDDQPEFVFTREDGRALRPEYVTKHFLKLAQDVGLPRVRLHDLRHTNASIALEAGIEVRLVSERLGHASTSITNDIYTHVSGNAGRAAAHRLGAFIAGDSTEGQPDPVAAFDDGEVGLW